jgi:hypothetical protein
MRGSEPRMNTAISLSNTSMVSRLRAKSLSSVVRGMGSVLHIWFYLLPPRGLAAGINAIGQKTRLKLQGYGTEVRLSPSASESRRSSSRISFG